jgi:hypothetical protein
MSKSKRRKEGKRELVGSWRNLHTAVWLFGLAILFWKDWWWPGILVLVGISLVIEALLAQFVPHAFGENSSTAPAAPAPVATPPVAPVAENHAELLPSACPNCGAPIRGHDVKWTGPQSADCPYCGANLPMGKSR